VHDLQTREYFYFICEQWLALDKGDGRIEKNLMVASDSDKRKFNYLLSKETKKKLSDDHLWFSVFARPIQSSFTRLDRLTCCFVLLSISMLMNILYYGMQDNRASQDGLKIGPYLNFTPEQIGIGLISSIFIFFPSFFLVQLFRHIKRRRSTRMAQIKSLLNIKDHQESKEKKMKINEKVIKWLTSLIVSFVSSVFLTEPLLVRLSDFINKVANF